MLMALLSMAPLQDVKANQKYANTSLVIDVVTRRAFAEMHGGKDPGLIVEALKTLMQQGVRRIGRSSGAGRAFKMQLSQSSYRKGVSGGVSVTPGTEMIWEPWITHPGA